MKALTIQQPYASLIAQPDDWTHPAYGEAKRVENRTWPTSHVGQLAIHAGKGKDYLEPEDLSDLPGMAFGAIVAVARLAGCVRLALSEPGATHNGVPAWAQRRWPWLAAHRHVEGPVCWILSEVQVLSQPVPCRGGQFLWDVPAEVLARVNEQLQRKDGS